jgi:hypothetical protein
MVLLVNLAAISIAIALISALINGFGVQEYAAIALGIVVYFAAKAGLSVAVGYMGGRQDAQKVKQYLADLPPHVRRDLIDNAPSDVKDGVAGVLTTARDVGRFKRLIKELGAKTHTLDQAVRSNDALEEFATLLAPRDRIAAVLEHYGYAGPAAGKAKLVDLYWTLLAGGAGQWVGTTYLPAAALYDPNLLALLLKAQADGANPTVVAITALDYIEKEKRAAISALAPESGVSMVRAIVRFIAGTAVALLTLWGLGSLYYAITSHPFSGDQAALGAGFITAAIVIYKITFSARKIWP